MTSEEDKKAYKKTWYIANKTRILLERKTYQIANKNKIKEYNKIWRETNKDKIIIDKEKWYKTWKELNPEKSKELSKIWRINNPEKSKESCKKWSKNNPDKKRNNYLKTKYCITLDEYNNMFIEQEGNCKTCGSHQTELKTRLCVDHNHTNGEIRGLLCDNCNKSIGLLKEDIKTLENIIKYLSYNKNKKRN